MDKIEVIVGSDPEFGYKNRLDGRQILARDVPFATSGDLALPCGSWGLDGHQDIGEIRANQSPVVGKHISNIRDVLARLAEEMDMFPSLSILAGSIITETRTGKRGDAIGGHIHISSSRHRLEVHRKNLQQILGSFLWPASVLIEDRSSARERRTQSPYGHPGDIRDQFHGGIEYRPCGSWLVSPAIASGILSYAQALVHAYLLGVIDTNNPGIRSEMVLNELYNKEDWGDLYRQYEAGRTFWPLPLMREDRNVAGAIGYLNFLINSRKTWYEKVDLREAWDIEPYVPDNVLDDVISQECTTNIDGMSPNVLFQDVNPVRWPGPGLPHHDLFNALFDNGVRALYRAGAVSTIITMIDANEMADEYGTDVDVVIASTRHSPQSIGDMTNTLMSRTKRAYDFWIRERILGQDVDSARTLNLLLTNLFPFAMRRYISGAVLSDFEFLLFKDSVLKELVYGSASANSTLFAPPVRTKSMQVFQSILTLLNDVFPHRRGGMTTRPEPTIFGAAPSIRRITNPELYDDADLLRLAKRVPIRRKFLVSAVSEQRDLWRNFIWHTSQMFNDDEEIDYGEEDDE